MQLDVICVYVIVVIVITLSHSLHDPFVLKFGVAFSLFQHIFIILGTFVAV